MRRGTASAQGSRRRTKSIATGRGEDENEVEEPRRGLVLAVLTLIASHAGTGAGATIRTVSTAADQAAAGALRSGRSGLQDLQGKILRIPPDVLASLPDRMGLPEPGEAGRRKVVPRAQNSVPPRARKPTPMRQRRRRKAISRLVPRPSLPALPRRPSVSPFEQLGPEGDKPANPASPAARSEAAGAIVDKPPADAPNAPRAGRTRPSSPPVGEAGPELSAPEQPARLGGATHQSLRACRRGRHPRRRRTSAEHSSQRHPPTRWNNAAGCTLRHPARSDRHHER